MEQKDKLQRLRQVGFITKGTVYCLLGGLAGFAAFGAGGNINGKDGVMQFLLSLPLGKVLIAAITLGLAAYAVWRIYESYADPKSENNGDRRWRNKGSYLYSGLFYGSIAFSFGKALFSSPGGGDKKTAIMAQVLDKSWGPWLLWAIVAIVVGQAGFQAYIAYTGKFMKRLDDSPNQQKAYKLIKYLGRLGYYSRALVFGILAYFVARVIIDHNASVYKGTKGVFQYLLSLPFGTTLMAAAAFGLAAYGFFTIMVGRYSNLTKLA